jgi:cytochrome c-type biogenesis protein CcsB
VNATALAQVSNTFVYMTMLTLALAMVVFSISFAAGRRPVRTSANATVGAGSTALLEDAPAPSNELGRRSANIGMSLTWLATVLLLIGVVLRGIWAGRVPLGNMYEFSISSALGILVIFLVLSWKRDVRWLGLFVVTPVLLVLGLSVTVLYTEAAQLVPALKSYWLVIHVSAAMISAAAFTVAGASAALALAKSRWDIPHIPSKLSLETLTYRIIAFSFPIWTFAVVAGAIWAEAAWGRYWGWDPKETWAFITWVVYAAYLHARSTQGWRGNRSSWIAILGLVTFLINYFGVNFFLQGLHSYAGVG